MKPPNFTPAQWDNNAKVYLKLQGAPGPDNIAFDSVLKPSHTPAYNHVLEIQLKIFLDKFNPPFGSSAWVVLDWNKRPFVVGPWNHAEWVVFVQNFQRQANMWNDKFWLTPIGNFDRLDVSLPGRGPDMRPNVYCHLNVELVGSAAQAHKTIRPFSEII